MTPATALATGTTPIDRAPSKANQALRRASSILFISVSRLQGSHRAITFSEQSCDPAEIEPLDDIVASQFVDRIGRDDDFTMDDDVTAIGDPDRLVEVLLRHQHRQTEMSVELADLGDGLRDQERR